MYAFVRWSRRELLPKFEDEPESVQELHLGGLGIQDTELAHLGDACDNLCHLHTQCLNVSFNKIASVDWVRGFKVLSRLNLSHNQLQSLSGIESCIALQELNCSFNQIKQLDCLSSLSNLHTLYANDNQIDHVVHYLSSVDSLRWLYLDNNPVSNDLSTQLESASVLLTVYVRMAGRAVKLLGKRHGPTSIPDSTEQSNEACNETHTQQNQQADTGETHEQPIQEEYTDPDDTQEKPEEKQSEHVQQSVQPSQEEDSDSEETQVAEDSEVHVQEAKEGRYEPEEEVKQTSVEGMNHEQQGGEGEWSTGDKPTTQESENPETSAREEVGDNVEKGFHDPTVVHEALYEKSNRDGVVIRKDGSCLVRWPNGTIAISVDRTGTEAHCFRTLALSEKGFVLASFDEKRSGMVNYENGKTFLSVASSGHGLVMTQQGHISDVFNLCNATENREWTLKCATTLAFKVHVSTCSQSNNNGNPRLQLSIYFRHENLHYKIIHGFNDVTSSLLSHPMSHKPNPPKPLKLPSLAKGRERSEESEQEEYASSTRSLAVTSNKTRGPRVDIWGANLEPCRPKKQQPARELPSIASITASLDESIGMMLNHRSRRLVQRR